MKPRTLIFAGLMTYGLATFAPMAVMSIGLALVLAALAAAYYLDRRQARGQAPRLLADPAIRNYALASMAMLGVIAASLLAASVSPYWPKSMAVDMGWIRSLSKGAYLFVPIALAWGWRRLDPKQQSKLFKVWLIAFTLLSALGVIQFFTGFPRPQANPQLPGRFVTCLLFGHHLSLASIWIFPFFISLDLWVRPKSRKAIGLGLGWVAAATVLGLFVLFFSYSRMLWIALPVGMALWLLARAPGKLRYAAAAGLLVTLAIGSQLEPVRHRLLHPMGTQERYALWEGSWEVFKERPLLGVGFGKSAHAFVAFREARYPGQALPFVGHAHNMFIEMLSSTGILGLVAWLGWLGVLGWLLVRAQGGDLAFPLALGCAWVVFLLNGLTQVNFWEGKVFHQVLWTSGWVLSWNFRSKVTRD